MAFFVVFIASFLVQYAFLASCGKIRKASFLIVIASFLVQHVHLALGEIPKSVSDDFLF
jgi:hypothetical protein